jgi:hypothetical protein
MPDVWLTLSAPALSLVLLFFFTQIRSKTTCASVSIQTRMGGEIQKEGLPLRCPASRGPCSTVGPLVLHRIFESQQVPVQSLFLQLLFAEAAEATHRTPPGTRGFAKALNQKLNVVLKEVRPTAYFMCRAFPSDCHLLWHPFAMQEKQHYARCIIETAMRQVARVSWKLCHASL